MSSRTLIKGGMIVDGRGTPAQKLDLVVEDNRIAAIGPDLESDSVVIDAHGLCVSPGFIDIHSHADFSLLAFPTADSAVMQGITTVATGNCGGGVAPVSAPQDIARVAFAFDPAWNVDIDWSSFGEYTQHLDGCAVNVAPLVAHGPIRHFVMGMQPGPPTETQLDQMATLLAEALDEGAFGMSTGLEYQPGIWAQEDELRRLVAEVGSRDRLYATHMRGRAEGHGRATAEALRVSGDTGARVQLSHFASRPNAPQASSDRAFDLVAEAVSSGRRVGVDTFPEIWGPALLIDLFPEEVMKGPAVEVLKRLKSPQARRELVSTFEDDPAFLASVAGYEQIYIADTPGDRSLTGHNLTGLAAERDMSVAEACCDILVQAGEEYRSVAIRHIYATESDLRRTMALPYCAIESDGVITAGEDQDCSLIWNASSYGYTARVLAHYVRDQEFLTLEEAVRRMTSLPASALGLDDRGTIEVGNYADLVVFSATDVEDRSRPDAPARHPRGIAWVFVNGVSVVSDGVHSGAQTGRLLRP